MWWLLLAGCLFASPDPGEPVQTPLDTDTAGDPCALYTWDVVGAPFVRTWCTPCHGAALPPAQRSGAPPDVDLDTEADVLAHAARVLARTVGDNPTMPPAAGPDEAERALFATYVACLTGG